MSPTAEVTSTPVRIKDILVATDFGKCSEAAMAYAITLARHYSSRLHVIHVFDPALENESRGQVERRAAELDRSRQLAEMSHCVSVETGDVIEVLTRRAQQTGVDLVVVGTHGRHGISKLVAGSVSEQLFRHASVPVLTIGPSVSIGGAVDFHRVVHPTDFSSASQIALPYAVSIAEEYGSELFLLHAIIPSEVPWEDPTREAVSRCEDRLAALVPASALVHVKPQCVAEYGLAAETIVNVARQRKAGLIVMGVHSKGIIAASTHFPWPVAHNVVCNAPCPILTIRD
jgi:nucleotide-binding universal stress UspA family protein